MRVAVQSGASIACRTLTELRCIHVCRNADITNVYDNTMTGDLVVKLPPVLDPGFGGRSKPCLSAKAQALL